MIQLTICGRIGDLKPNSTGKSHNLGVPYSVQDKMVKPTIVLGLTVARVGVHVAYLDENMNWVWSYNDKD